MSTWTSSGLNKQWNIIGLNNDLKHWLDDAQTNGHRFRDNSLKYVFLKNKFCILIFKFIPNGSFDSALVQVTASCRTDDVSLPEPMMAQSTDLYTRLQWLNDGLSLVKTLTDKLLKLTR